ncbi:hypothetical protein VTH82DRAFT_7562 [Thermothelomyces myriococcoides]
MGKSSKKRERTGEDVADTSSDAKPAVKKSKLDSNGNAEVTKKNPKVKETRPENSVSDEVSELKKEKKEKKKDKKEKKAKKEKKTKEGEGKSNDADSAASKSNELAPAQDAISEPEPEPEAKEPVNGVESGDGKVKKKNKKSKKDKRATTEDAQPTTTSNGDSNNSNSNSNSNSNHSGKHTRFICFVGNLPYTATADSVRAHFATLQPTSVRLLTRRDDPTKSRGIAFVEFGSYDRMKTCLQKFHHTQFDDGKSPPRRINVELTAGGGGKTAARLEKIKQKNAKLNEERAQRMKKEKEEAAKHEKAATATADEKTQEQREEEAIHPSRRGRVPYARN